MKGLKKYNLLLLRKNRFIGYKIKYLSYFIFKRNRLQKGIGIFKGNKIIYIVKPDTEDGIEGLLSLVARTSLYIRNGLEHGYTVFVDWKNYKTQYYNGNDNAWNYFFKQPSNVEVPEINNYSGVILSGWTMYDLNPKGVYTVKQFKDKSINKECYELLTRTLRFSDEVMTVVDSESENLGIENCIGLYVRGTDYIKLKPSGEYRQPKLCDVQTKVNEFTIKYPKSKIFLVTEDGHIYDALSSEYGDKIVTVSYDSFIYNYLGDTYLSKSDVMNINKKRRGLDYLTKMILLSKCKYLISSITMGSMFSYGLNGNQYKDEYIFDLGLYP